MLDFRGLTIVQKPQVALNKQSTNGIFPASFYLLLYPQIASDVRRTANGTQQTNKMTMMDVMMDVCLCAMPMPPPRAAPRHHSKKPGDCENEARPSSVGIYLNHIIELYLAEAKRYQVQP